MTPKHFFVAEGHQGTSNLDSRTGGEAITVTPNFPGKPDRQEVFLGISMDWSGAKPGEAWAAVDADKLRDAINKAVGPRSEPAPHEGHKPYRPLDRDRLLRHIKDIEATLTRRNERHERDQERIRELEAEVFRMKFAKEEAERREGQLRTLTAREYLDLAWEAAIVPEDGMIHVGESFLCKDESGIRQPSLGDALYDIPMNHLDVERRLMEPRPEPSKEDSYRKELEDKGLAEWEIEMLVGSAA